MRCSAARRSAARPPVLGSRRDADHGVPLTMVFEPRGRSSIAITGVVHGHLAPDVARGVIAILGPILGRRAGAFREALRPWTHERLRQVRSRPCRARTVLPERSRAGTRPGPSGHGRWARTTAPPTTARAGLGGDLRSCGGEEEAPHAAGTVRANRRPTRRPWSASAWVASTPRLGGRAGTANPTRGGASPHPRPAGWPARTTTGCGCSPSSLCEERYEIQREVVRRDGADSVYEPRCPAAPSAVCADARLAERRAADCWGCCGWRSRRHGQWLRVRDCGRRNSPITHPLMLQRHLRFCRREQRFRVPLPEDAGRADAGPTEPRQASDQRERVM
jgi:hypothetical protein